MAGHPLPIPPASHFPAKTRTLRFAPKALYPVVALIPMTGNPYLIALLRSSRWRPGTGNPEVALPATIGPLKARPSLWSPPTAHPETVSASVTGNPNVIATRPGRLPSPVNPNSARVVSVNPSLIGAVTQAVKPIALGTVL